MSNEDKEVLFDTSQSHHVDLTKSEGAYDSPTLDIINAYKDGASEDELETGRKAEETRISRTPEMPSPTPISTTAKVDIDIPIVSPSPQNTQTHEIQEDLENATEIMRENIKKALGRSENIIDITHQASK